jgi:hypothetical protein
MLIVRNGSDTIDVRENSGRERTVTIWECDIVQAGIRFVSYEALTAGDRMVYRHRGGQTCEPREYRVLRCEPASKHLWMVEAENVADGTCAA